MSARVHKGLLEVAILLGIKSVSEYAKFFRAVKMSIEEIKK